jgi:MSHA biogenesis protein MshN
MSVINQMLKDLDQRSPEYHTHASSIGNVVLAYSPIKVAIITGICVLAVCFISFYAWQLITENNILKAQYVTNGLPSPEVSATNNITKRGDLVAATRSNALAVVATQNNAVNNTVNRAKKLITHNIGKTVSNINTSEQAKQPEYKQGNHKVRTPINLKATQPSDETKVLSNNLTGSNAQLPIQKLVINNNSSDVMPINKASAIQEPPNHSGITLVHNHQLTSSVKSKVNKMSVSRRQLSADELAKQKLTLAEKALSMKQVNKAEKLLEDAVILRPSDSQTRKKLAALWFGRQAYQDAVNLLSQGISVNGKDSSLREMKARIHLKQGQFTAALNTLKPLAQLKNEQYQLMLANTAQQAQQNKVAVDAYKMLIVMKPDIGRWQLGLAILYDKGSQFDLASVAYKKALTKNDLSVTSENFVKQRIQIIGQ